MKINACPVSALRKSLTYTGEKWLNGSDWNFRLVWGFKLLEAQKVPALSSDAGRARGPGEFSSGSPSSGTVLINL